MAETITMTPRELSRHAIIQRLLNREINGTEAALQMNLSLRQTKNIKAKVIKLGPKGIIHQNRGKPGNRQLPEGQVSAIEKIIRAKYHDFGPTLASEKLYERDKIKINKETLRRKMIVWGLWRKRAKKKTKEYRCWRKRKERFGEMEQFDGSYFQWFEERAPECCLLAAVDDALGSITGLLFVNWEGVKNAFSFWKIYFEKHGKPSSVYLDRHSTYKQNHKATFDDPNCLTQFERAMNDCDVRVIHARSPQAKGRIERIFETLQDRLVKEMRLANINGIASANKFANEIFLPRFNQRFAVKPAKRGNVHRKLALPEKECLDQILSIHSQRVVANDFTVRFNGIWYQLDKKQPILVRPRDRVKVEERLDGTTCLSLNNKLLSFSVLPKRPNKIAMPVIALSPVEPAWKPPIGHPWRQPFLFGKRQTTQEPIEVSIVAPGAS